MKLLGSPWTRFYSNSCCLCCHVRTGTIILGIWYLILNAVVLLIILSLDRSWPVSLSGTELSNDFEFMDDANMCIATAVSLLMILICAMATYATCAWIIPFFCYQIFDFALNTLVAISILVYPNTVQEYLQQLTFLFNNQTVYVNDCCRLIHRQLDKILMAYLISCVWNCYRYINNRNNSDVLVYITTNDTAVSLLGLTGAVRGSWV
uniref:Lysosomal protein transmembrane 4 beta n=1 Tax=Naja naja TaxID=35670 RepID=A0A8C6XD97_NAJNA